MKKVFCKMALASVLALTTLFTGCKAPSSGGGSAYNPPEKNIPLTLEAIADGQITFDNLDRIINLKYRINDGEVIAATDTGISLPAGDKISLFAEGTLNGNNTNQCFTINCSSDCYVYGNVMSLLTDDYQNETTITQENAFRNLFNSNTYIKNHPEKEIVLPATSLTKSCYQAMFWNCTSLTAAPILPSKKLSSACYGNMFFGCTSLTKAPSLPATTLEGSCYNGMFWNCTSLTAAPVLPATSLAEDCYGFMFKGCTSLTKTPSLPVTTLEASCYFAMFSGGTSLTKAPVLPATTLAPSCYCDMFDGCTSLNKVTCLATDLSATDCTTSWLSGVASSGTFTKASGADWSSGASGIPSGWTIKNK